MTKTTIYTPKFAIVIGDYEFGIMGDGVWYCERLVLDENGEFMLYGIGDPQTKYEGKPKVMPMTRDQAARWCYTHIPARQYETLFAREE